LVTDFSVASLKQVSVPGPPLKKSFFHPVYGLQRVVVVLAVVLV
jgi:hypothetical protein